MSVSILVLAAGRGHRVGNEVPKAYLPVNGEALLLRSIRALAEVAASVEAAEIVLAVHPKDRRPHLEPLLPALTALGVHTVVDGGASRQESMERALSASNPDLTLVLVHDAARPFFEVAAAREALAKAQEVGAALLAIPVPDTLKQVNRAGRVTKTVERDGLWLAQTPQVARRDLLTQALEAARQAGRLGTDDMALLERLGLPVAVVPGSARNLKITTRDDLQVAEALARLQDEAPQGGAR